MTRSLKVVAGLDLDEKIARAAERKRAWPLHKKWLIELKRLVAGRALLHFDYMVAEALLDFPSANLGYAYPGQRRLGRTLGRSDRTVRDSIKRLRNLGLLISRHGGPGRTSRWIFCIDGVPIFDVANSGQDRRDVAALDRRDVAALDRRDVAEKPTEPQPGEDKPLPNPPHDTVVEEGQPEPSDQKSRKADTTATITSIITFDRFWDATGGGHPSEPPGPAEAHWHKLSTDDQRAIGGLINLRGNITLDGRWALTWLKARRWEQPGTAPAKPALKVVKPDTPEWHAEYARRRAAGEPTWLMDDHAAKGAEITVRIVEYESSKEDTTNA